MSRIGKLPVPILKGVEVKQSNGSLTVKGPKGEMVLDVHPDMKVVVDEAEVRVERASDQKAHRALHGLTRSLIANMVTGVKDGFERKLEIVGIGYRCQIQGKALQLALGYSHPVIFPLPEGIQAEVDRQVSITLRGADKALLGQTAAKLRALRKPDPYKGKGIKYADEHIRRKVGNKAGAK
jgi:large subunit ribosomal protein L6